MFHAEKRASTNFDKIIEYMTVHNKENELEAKRRQEEKIDIFKQFLNKL